MSKFYYVTVASGSEFILSYTQYSIKSLIKCGVDETNIHVVGNDESDLKLLKDCLPYKINFYKLEEDLSKVKWKVYGGKRKYSFLKSSALYNFFGKPVPDKYMIYFDGDVLWYKNPEPFFETKCNKTWFHHGKSLQKRSESGRNGMTSKDINVSDFNSLSKWCSIPQAHLMIKYRAKVVPEREVVAGLYLLHPKDHESILKMTYEGCVENMDKFLKHEGAGDQKPMNASLSILNIDWHGGSRFLCPEHIDYFDHFYGKQNLKKIFLEKVKKMGL